MRSSKVINLAGKDFVHGMVSSGGLRSHIVSGGQGIPVVLMAGFP